MTINSDGLPTEKIGERVRIFRRGLTWHANYQFQGRQCRESLKTSNKKNAISKAYALDRKLADGEMPVRVQPATIAEAIAAYREYLTTEQRSAKTISKYSAVFDRVETLAQEMRRSSLAQLDIGFVDRYRSRRSKTCQPKTVYTETVIIRQLVKFAFKRSLVLRDPLVGLTTRKPKPTPQPCFSDVEIEQIHLNARPPHDATFLLLAETGLRFGEAQWLTWADIDFQRNVIHVRAKEGWKPKTGDQRAVPMSPRLRQFLKQRPNRCRWVLTASATKTHPSIDRQISERRALAALKRVIGPLKFIGKLHSFRHSFISRCLTRGIEESVVREWVGHVDPTIMRLYTHINSQISQERMQRLGAIACGDTPDEKNPDSAK